MKYRPFPERIILVLVVSIFLHSCAKDNAEPIYQQCLLTKSYSQGDTSHSSVNFYYDNAGRLIKIIRPSPPGTTWGTNISYGSNSVIITDIGSSAFYTRYYLTPDTLAYASATYAQGTRTDTVNYYYDAAKFLVKVIRNNHVVGRDSTALSYSNNNLVLIRTYMSNGAVEQSAMEYGTDESKAWYYQNNAPYLHFDSYYPWLGKSSINLVKSFSFTYNGNPDPVSLSYTLNASGYITTLITNHLGNTSRNNFEYSCR